MATSNATVYGRITGFYFVQSVLLAKMGCSDEGFHVGIFY
jgi:hypothetical protein